LEDGAKFCSKCRFEQPEKAIEPEETKPIKIATVKKLIKNNKVVKKSAKEPEKKKSNYQEKKQAIYDMTSQDNCGDCGCKNCMQFAMQAASSKNSMELSDCPYIDEDDAQEFLNSFDDENGNEDDNQGTINQSGNPFSLMLPWSLGKTINHHGKKR